MKKEGRGRNPKHDPTEYAQLIVLKEFDKKTGEVVGYAIYNVKKHKSPRKNLQVDIPKSILSSMGAPV